MFSLQPTAPHSDSTIFNRSGQSCPPVDVRFAPKADLKRGATGRRRVEAGRTHVIQAPEVAVIFPGPVPTR